MVKKSMALVIVLSVVVILAFLGTTIIARSIAESRQVRRYVQSTKSFWLAEAGFNRGFWELNYGDGSWDSWADVGNGHKSMTASISGEGEYVVQVYNPIGSQRLVAATRYVPSVSDPQCVFRQLAVTVTNDLSPHYSFGGFGERAVYIGGNRLYRQL